MVVSRVTAGRSAVWCHRSLVLLLASKGSRREVVLNDRHIVELELILFLYLEETAALSLVARGNVAFGASLSTVCGSSSVIKSLHNGQLGFNCVFIRRGWRNVQFKTLILELWRVCQQVNFACL